MAPPLPVDARRDGGRYVLRSLLGRGGMGEVYLAHDERLRRSVAIKRIRAAEGDEAMLRARLEYEARVLAQLGHPAIVQVFDIFEDDDGAWVVMELVQGRSLAAVLDEEPIDVDDALRYGIAITAALDTAHRQGIVHRDLKVENVMLSATGHIKVLDFGLAKRLLPSESMPSLSVEGQVLGTVRTMSPEQARGLAVDQRSDLFSLGVLLYELLSGISPFAGASALDTLVRLSTHRQTPLIELPDLADRIPRALSELVDQLLEKATERRPASAAEVHSRLQAIAAARPQTPPAAGSPDDRHDASPMRRRWAALGEQSTEIAPAVTTPLKAPRDRATPADEPTPDAPPAEAGEPSSAPPGPSAEAGAPPRDPPMDPAPPPGEASAPPEHSPLPGEPSRASLAPPGMSAGDAIAVSRSALEARGQSLEPSADEPAPDHSAVAAEPGKTRRARRYLVLAGLGAAAAASFAVILPGTGGERAPVSSHLPAAALPAEAAARPEPRRDPKAEYERGMALLRNFHRRGALEEAAGIFQRLLQDDERSAPAYAGLARAYWLQYSITDASRDPMFLQQAKAAADRAVALDEFLVDARVSHGLVAQELGQPDQAEKDFQAALALDARSASAYAGLAWLSRKRNRLDESEAAYRKAIALDPDNREHYDDLGAVVVERGRYQDAIPLFEKSIALAPDSAYGYSNLGAVYLALGRYAEAAQRFQDALKIQPSATLYTNLGTVLFAEGLYGPSATAFEHALAMGGAAHQHVSWGNLADAYRQLPGATAKAREHYDHAIAILDAELAKSPRDPTLLTRRVLYLARRGDCPRADGGLSSLSGDRDLPLYAVFRVAMALEICGHRDRAIAALERALGRGFPPAEIDGEPDLRALRADPAYQRMLQRRGNLAAKTAGAR